MKNLLNFGEALNKADQKNIYGGNLVSYSNCLTNGCPANEVCTQVFHDPDGSGPQLPESQWLCIDPTNHK